MTRLSRPAGTLPLYHGTRRVFTRGGLVLPASVTGVPVNHEEAGSGSRAEWVYVILGPRPRVGIRVSGSRSRPDSRPRVLEAIPLEEVEVDESTVYGGSATLSLLRGVRRPRPRGLSRPALPGVGGSTPES